MSIKFICWNCAKQLTARDEHAGLKAKCTECGSVNHIPGTKNVEATFGDEPNNSNDTDDEVSEYYADNIRYHYRSKFPFLPVLIAVIAIVIVVAIVLIVAKKGDALADAGKVVGSVGLLILIIFLGLFIYFIPSFVAHSREHKNKTSILVLNIFLGWTFLGWVTALVWAFTAQDK